MKISLFAFAILALFLAGPLVTLASGSINLTRDWQKASHHSAGIAPNPADHPEAIIQVYVARAFGWRGAFGVHSWIAIKPEGAPRFTVHEVIGWRAFRGLDPVSVSQRDPDAHWYGNPPEIIADLRGPAAADAIPRLIAASDSYPHRDGYRAWPGPNSNTFVAHVARQVPELRLDLPPTAIGKDYIPEGGFVAASPSGTGYQVSLFGLLGVLASVEEGLEINFLALTLGLDPLDMAIKLPGVGRVGPATD